ncbi:TIGR04149 family rSAM-modified RiPP [Flavobacterium psychrophilum]|uniref:TIGR04149 family rSAM-modified RiPP n=1 Tax=Flavobacterium psychrophilum TaxID=96345 RepID=UPI002CB8EFF5|nr:TIGR04149 family rSAM-modified RiPP [Flavobacterium psychrophilum]
MKKLELKNLKVVKLSKEEKSNVKGGLAPAWETSQQCNCTSHPYVSWCNGC